MKKILLGLILSITVLAANAQSVKSDLVSVYPNPATDYIAVNNEDIVKNIFVFNLVGRKMKSFEIEKGNNHYEVSDLPNGVYVVQVIGRNNKVLTTQRLTKKS